MNRDHSATEVDAGRSLRVYEGTTAPSIGKGESQLWWDTANSKLYLVANFNGTVKKTELT